jgi:hypothetical protein
MSIILLCKIHSSFVAAELALAFKNITAGGHLHNI